MISALALATVGRLWRRGQVSDETRARLKMVILRGDRRVAAAVARYRASRDGAAFDDELASLASSLATVSV